MALKEDIAIIKKKLYSYGKEHNRFNDPHFTQQLILREGSKEEVINNIIDPEKLVHYQLKKESTVMTSSLYILR